MSKALFAFVFLVPQLIIFGQKSDTVANKALQFTLGRTFNGSGDVVGISYNGLYTKYFRKKSCLFAELGGSIHDGSKPLFFDDPNGNTIDATIHYTTAGFQGVFGLGTAFLRNKKHELLIKLGVLGRYQSTSYWDNLYIFFPAITGLPFPAVVFENFTPRQTMSVGGRGSLSYSFTLHNKMILSCLASLQTDSNGDVISGIELGIGKRY